MEKQKNAYEVIKFEDGEFSLDVNVSPTEDTVWLNRQHLSKLFNRDIKTIGKHIKNALTEEFANQEGVVAFFATTATDGKVYNVEYYNLDVILSVGYRVNSQRGILFRKWATSILKQYMLKGYSINEKRCLECQDNIISLNNKVESLFNQSQATLSRLNYLENRDAILSAKLFYEGQIFDAYSYIKQLFLSANTSIILIDGYIDLSVLDMLIDIKVPIIIYTYSNAQLTNQDIDKFNIKHNLEVIRTNRIHDRFIIIDNTIYLCGSSIKDVGKKRFVLLKVEFIKIEDLLKNITF